MKTWHSFCFLFYCCLTGCSLAPDDSVSPDVEVPAIYKEEADIDSDEEWVPARPEAAETDHGAWWKIYDSQELNSLEEKLSLANQELQVALAHYEEAQALAKAARSDLFPSLTGSASGTRQKISLTPETTDTLRRYNTLSLSGGLSYEADLWGRIRNSVASAGSQAQASGADAAAVLLSLQSELAIDYFALRGQDAAQQLANQSVHSYDKALRLTQHRHAGGIAAEADVDQAKLQWEQAKALAADVKLKRAQLEHAIAVLVGENPSTFTVPAQLIQPTISPIVPDLPSTLLTQRPDIISAQWRVKAANADIGVARAAYFPQFLISGTGGVENNVLTKLLDAPSLFWSVGPSALVTLLDGGKIRALNEKAQSAYQASVANYRQTVLTAFQEVEDSLVAFHQLTKEKQAQEKAAEAAYRWLDQANQQYVGGIATYLDIVSAENASLQAQLTTIDLQTQQLGASISLIKALGGTWDNHVDES